MTQQHCAPLFVRSILCRYTCYVPLSWQGRMAMFETLSTFMRRSLVGALTLACSQFASADPTVGSANVASADPVIPAPYTTPCSVVLYSNQEFAAFNTT